MKKVYICPNTRVLKSGLEDFILEYNVVGNSRGTDDAWSKKRGLEEENATDVDFWGTSN